MDEELTDLRSGEEEVGPLEEDRDGEVDRVEDHHGDVQQTDDEEVEEVVRVYRVHANEKEPPEPETRGQSVESPEVREERRVAELLEHDVHIQHRDPRQGEVVVPCHDQVLQRRVDDEDVEDLEEPGELQEFEQGRYLREGEKDRKPARRKG